MFERTSIFVCGCVFLFLFDCVCVCVTVCVCLNYSELKDVCLDLSWLTYRETLFIEISKGDFCRDIEIRDVNPNPFEILWDYLIALE